MEQWRLNWCYYRAMETILELLRGNGDKTGANMGQYKQNWSYYGAIETKLELL